MCGSNHNPPLISVIRGGPDLTPVFLMSIFPMNLIRSRTLASVGKAVSDESDCGGFPHERLFDSRIPPSVTRHFEN